MQRLLESASDSTFRSGNGSSPEHVLGRPSRQAFGLFKRQQAPELLPKRSLDVLTMDGR